MEAPAPVSKVLAVKSMTAKNGREGEQIKKGIIKIPRLPPVSSTPIVENIILSQQPLVPYTGNPNKGNSVNIGGLPLYCLMSNRERFNDFIYRLNIGIKFMQPTYKMTPSPFLANDRKNRRKADKLYQKLYNLIVELHKLCFNIHYMMAQLEINEWGLTRKKYNHLFHELRDGSWTLSKLLDDALDNGETFRKYILILDVYSKVLMDEFFKNWRSLVQLVCDRKRGELSQELMAFQNNFCGIKSKYDYLKKYGYVPQLSYEEIERFYREKKRHFFAEKPKTLSPRSVMMLKDVFGDRFFRRNFLRDIATTKSYDLKSICDEESDEENDELSLKSLLMLQPGLAHKPKGQCKQQEKIKEGEFEEALESFKDSADEDCQSQEIEEDNANSGSEQDKSDEEYFTGIDE